MKYRRKKVLIMYSPGLEQVLVELPWRNIYIYLDVPLNSLSCYELKKPFRMTIQSTICANNVASFRSLNHPELGVFQAFKYPISGPPCRSGEVVWVRLPRA